MVKTSSFRWPFGVLPSLSVRLIEMRLSTDGFVSRETNPSVDSRISISRTESDGRTPKGHLKEDVFTIYPLRVPSRRHNRLGKRKKTRHHVVDPNSLTSPQKGSE